jgi:hypothetical protein
METIPELAITFRVKFGRERNKLIRVFVGLLMQ